MAKNIRKVLAMILVVCIFVSALPMQALAAETETSTETSPEGLPTSVKTTTNSSTDASGNTTVTVTIEKNTEGTTSDGVTVKREETDTVTKVSDSNGNILSEVGVNEGKEITTNAADVPVDNVTAAVPNKVGESNTVKYGETGVITGDKKQGEGDSEYDQTTTTQYGTVTVKNEGSETKDNTVDKNGNPIVGTELDYVMNDTAPSATNDLIIENASKAPDDRMPGSNVENPDAVTGVEGYTYVYIGTGNTSQFRPAVVYKNPLNDEEIWMVPTSSPYLNTTNKVHNPEDMDRVAKDEHGN